MAHASSTRPHRPENPSIMSANNDQSGASRGRLVAGGVLFLPLPEC
jgi:hypothetical protein